MLTESTRETGNVKHAGFSLLGKGFASVPPAKLGMDALNNLVSLAIL